jgi:hypothetical protein
VKVKLNALKKVQLLELCNTFIGHIGRLELELEKNKAPHNVSTSNETFELRAELKELKEAVFIDATGTNACGDVPVGLTQEYWDTGNRRVISWDTIHKLAAEQGGTNVEDNGTGHKSQVDKDDGDEDKAYDDKAVKDKTDKDKAAANTADRTSGRTSDGDKHRNSEHRPVCPTMMRGDRCTGCKGFKHPKTCEVHTSATRQRDCRLWHFRHLLSNHAGGTLGNSGGHPQRVSSNVARLTAQNLRLKTHIET